MADAHADATIDLKGSYTLNEPRICHNRFVPMLDTLERTHRRYWLERTFALKFRNVTKLLLRVSADDAGP
jgi:hypothetical protein